MYRLIDNVPVCINKFILTFLPLCSMLVYYGYSNANVGPWQVKTYYSCMFK